MNKIVKNTLILTAITVVAGLLLGVVYGVTKDPIAKAQEKAKQEAFRSVLFLMQRHLNRIQNLMLMQLPLF